MAVAGSAIGIASLGIQTCQGLLSYYDDWKGYNSDVSSAYDSIDDLSRTLVSIKASLDSDEFGEEKKGRVKRCVHSCEDSLVKLSQKSQKLRKHEQPEGLCDKAWKELQRAWYPFRASTLVRLQEIVADARERLELAVQVLQLDVSATSQRILKSVAADTSNLVNRTMAIATSVAHVSAQTQQVLDLQQSDQFKKIEAWLSPPDPSTNHKAARRLHEPHTGTWLLQADRYQRWKAGDIKHLWLYGKAGCGKTVLFYTVVEDIRVYCKSRKNTMHTAFYFTFSDNRKQSYEDLLLSLVAQLGWDKPGPSMLMQAYEKPNASVPGVDELEKIVLACFQSYDELFLLLDALDECLESKEARQNVLDGLERLVQGAPSTRMFVTSREVGSVGDSMQALGADVLPVASQLVNADIQRYISTQLARDRNLSKLDATARNLIESTISQRADGMFRWAYCQLQELKTLKSTRPSHVREALFDLPETLDQTYERMLTGIEKRSRKDALILLRWLAFARSPLSLGELAEARVIDPTGDGGVDVDDRGGLEDVLEILSGLITIDGVDDDHDKTKGLWSEYSDSRMRDQNVWHSIRRVQKDAKVRLAHFSVKEYLESERIPHSNAKIFYLESAKEHRFLAQSCLTYLRHYSSSEEKASDRRDLTAFPLLQYAAQSWFYHSSLQLSGDVSGEVSLLASESAIYDWLLVHQPDWPLQFPFTLDRDVGKGLYYACFLGLGDVADSLLSAGADVDAPGGQYGHALQAASYSGHHNIAKMLIAKGADVNVVGGEFGSALGAAATEGYKELAEMLIAKGANVNTGGGMFDGSPLFAALSGRHEDIAELLIDNGADVNSEMSAWHESPLLTAIDRNCSRIVEMLITLGVNHNTMRAVSCRGDDQVMQMLINAGADVNVNANGGLFGNVLQAASFGGHEKVVKMLLDAGAHVNAQGGECGNALQAASYGGEEKVVKMLILRGADVNAQGGRYGNALQAASYRGYAKVVEMLINAGAHVNAQGGECGNALQAASARGHANVVKMLLQTGPSATDPS